MSFSMSPASFRQAIHKLTRGVGDSLRRRNYCAKHPPAVAMILAAALGAFCLAAAVRADVAAEALTLDAYFAQALLRSETLATQGELIAQAEERYRQANAALYPTLSGIGSYTWLDSGGQNLALNPVRQPNARLALSQPLFRGLSEFAARRQTQALVDAQDDDYRSARAQLYKDVAQNFYDVLSFEQELKNLDEQIEQFQQREKELQERVRIGRTGARSVQPGRGTGGVTRSLRPASVRAGVFVGPAVGGSGRAVRIVPVRVELGSPRQQFYLLQEQAAQPRQLRGQLDRGPG